MYTKCLIQPFDALFPLLLTFICHNIIILTDSLYSTLFSYLYRVCFLAVSHLSICARLLALRMNSWNVKPTHGRQERHYTMQAARALTSTSESQKELRRSSSSSYQTFFLSFPAGAMMGCNFVTMVTPSRDSMNTIINWGGAPTYTYMYACTTSDYSFFINFPESVSVSALSLTASSSADCICTFISL